MANHRLDSIYEKVYFSIFERLKDKKRSFNSEIGLGLLTNYLKDLIGANPQIAPLIQNPKIKLVNTVVGDLEQDKDLELAILQVSDKICGVSLIKKYKDFCFKCQNAYGCETPYALAAALLNPNYVLLGGRKRADYGENEHFLCKTEVVPVPVTSFTIDVKSYETSQNVLLKEEQRKTAANLGNMLAESFNKLLF
ncbi:hypothetical protein HY643_02215 [Candidatus Woesearchaeota archaeon]|nr:hypothetical protein [Candidatus Woesearchaeota archaeon]